MGMSNIPYTWGEDAPEPLVHLCAKNVVENPDTFCDRYVDEGSWALKSGLTLPQEICERLINIWQEIGPERLDDEFVGMFDDITKTRLKRVVLRNSSVSGKGLKILLKHKLIELDISNCRKLSRSSVSIINSHGEDLTSLILSGNILHKLKNLFFDDLDKIGNVILNTPNLRRLVLRECMETKDLFITLLKPLSKLMHLDLSGCKHLGDLSFICHLKDLTTLILHGVQNINEAIPTICSLKKLRFLDISQVSIDNGMFGSPDSVLGEIVTSLQELSHLDISGTNLPGNGNFNADKDKEPTPTPEIVIDTNDDDLVDEGANI